MFDKSLIVFSAFVFVYISIRILLILITTLTLYQSIVLSLGQLTSVEFVFSCRATHNFPFCYNSILPGLPVSSSLLAFLARPGLSWRAMMAAIEKSVAPGLSEQSSSIIRPSSHSLPGPVSHSLPTSGGRQRTRGMWSANTSVGRWLALCAAFGADWLGCHFFLSGVQRERETD